MANEFVPTLPYQSYKKKAKSKSGGGGDDKHYTYEQLSPSNEWHVQHNLDKYPSVTVVDSTGRIVAGDCRIVDTNNVIIYFNGAFSGKAFFN